MKELQECAEHLQLENDRLWVQVEKRRDLDQGNTQDSGQAKQPVFHDKGKKAIAFDDMDLPEDDELSSSSSPNISPPKRNKDISHQKHSHRPAFSNFNNGTFRQAMGRGQNQPNEAPRNAFTLPTGAMPPM